MLREKGEKKKGKKKKKKGKRKKESWNVLSLEEVVGCKRGKK